MDLCGYVCCLLLLSLICQAEAVIRGGECKDYFERHAIRKNNTDIVFVLDRSGSVGAANFETEVGFVGQFLADFVVAPDATRVAVISFSNDATVHMDFIKRPGNKCMVIRELEQITYEDSRATNTAAGLLKALDVFSNAPNRNAKVLVLITDGLHTLGPDPSGVANQLKNIGVEIHVFGIGRYMTKELDAIASSPKHICECESFTKFKKLYGKGVKNQWNRQDTPEACNYKCHVPSDDHGCCDVDAICGCSITTGVNDCLCKPGYFGDGLKGSCHPCEIGYYQNEYGQRGCKYCPMMSTTEDMGSSSIDDCKCLTGYKRSPGKAFSCTEVTCPPLQAPANGKREFCTTQYNSECYFDCNEGFMLEDEFSSSRVCQENGTWSSKTPVCIPLRCDKKPLLTNGSLVCPDDPGEATFNTTCRYTCQKGHTLIGQSHTTCTGYGIWSGEKPKCELVGCVDPPVLLFGQPRGKSAKKVYNFRDTYKLRCRHGFKLVGSLFSICDERGRWIFENQQPPKCIDTTPPKITCPVRIVLNAEPGRNTANLTWQEPQSNDNSRKKPIITQDPADLKSPATLQIGTHYIVYNATDHANLTSSCTLQIDVIDNQKPEVVYCPGDIRVSTTDTMVAVQWKEPQFTDNSGRNVTVTQSNRSGDLFDFGSHNVVYRATDPSNNLAYCKFSVHVSRSQCPYYPFPRNGALTCEEFMYGDLCQVLCNEKYDFVAEPAAWYICDSSLTWSTEPEGMPLPWPDCSIPSSAAMKKSYKAHYFTGDCRDELVQNSIRKIFQTNFQDFKSQSQLCTSEAKCKLNKIFVYCGDGDDIRGVRRGRRSVSLKEQYTVAEIDAELYFTPLTNRTTDIEELSASIDEAFTGLGEVPQSILDDVVAENSVSLEMTLLDASIGDTFLICGEGKVLSGQQCVACPAGTYHDKAQDLCAPCRKGEYQEVDGSTSCKPCPANTMTETVKSSSIDDCRAVCNKGTYSSTGLETCISCPRGTYQDEAHQTSCKACPEGTITELTAATGIEDCKPLCPPGTMSDTGLEPCSLCKKGFYQAYSGQRSCDECVFPLTTNKTGSVSHFDCDEFDHCLSDPCHNNGICDAHQHHFACICPPGYYGETCDVRKDSCHGEPCKNGGTCLVKGDLFRCSCFPGYEGERCEIARDLCLDLECLNGGECTVQDEVAICHCPPGFFGEECEEQQITVQPA